MEKSHQIWEKEEASSGKYLGFEKSPGQPKPIIAAIMWLQAPTFRCPLLQQQNQAFIEFLK